MADKCDAKEYVANIIGRQHIIPTLGVWTRFDEINFDELPEKFVLKCTHDSGGIVICNDKDKFDKPAAKSKIEKSLKRNYYWAGREWPYKNIKPRIIAEKYLADAEDNQIADELRDYKFFCFHGKVRCFKIDFDRFTNHRANYYSTEKKLLKFGEKEFPPDFSKNLDIPPNINDMIRLAEKLSAGYPFIRVDLYDIAGQIYFGELTLYPACGFGAFIPPEWDLKPMWLHSIMKNEMKYLNGILHGKEVDDEFRPLLTGEAARAAIATADACTKSRFEDRKVKLNEIIGK